MGAITEKYELEKSSVEDGLAIVEIELNIITRGYHEVDDC